jgi:SAM-dependent methyltransferase
MQRGFYLQTSRIEESHWWFTHRRRLVEAILERELGRGRGERIALDVGCGSGGNLDLLRRYCASVAGLDRSEYALQLARLKEPGATLVHAEANQLRDRFSAESLDLVTVFNVLYHRWIANDAAVLSQIHDLLRPGGVLVLTEPAFRTLFRRHDDLDYGARRYRLGQLVGKTHQVGFAIRRASYFNVIGFVPAWFVARFERWTGRTGSGMNENETATELTLPAPWLNRTLHALLWPERAWISRGGRFPLGVSLLVVAKKATS